MSCTCFLKSRRCTRSQGQHINDKHFEVIIRKMMAKGQVTRPGDAPFLPGDLVDMRDLKLANEGLLEAGKRAARFVGVLLGITKASLSTDSVPFRLLPSNTRSRCWPAQRLLRVKDPLYGLKENVIIGKLIPAGTGFVHGRFAEPEEKQAQPGAW